MEKYKSFAVEKTKEILAIDSPTGFTKNATEYLIKELKDLGYNPEYTKKGGVIVDLGGTKDGLLLTAHVDTLGGMVAEIKGDGRLRLTNLGGLRPENCECENVKVYTRGGEVYDGTFNIINPSVHVNLEYAKIERKFDNMEVVLDKDVKTDKETADLGILVGDIVAFNPRTTLTGGYIKSRFLDDKLAVGVLLGYAKYIKDEKITLPRKVYIHFTVYEEVGHGCSASCPSGVTEILSVDMGCVGKGLNCTEKQVSICSKDSGGPYNYEMVSRLIESAKKENADYAIDVYPGYGSDAEATLSAGADVKHALIGPGVYASHGYERSHENGVLNTLKVLKGFIA